MTASEIRELDPQTVERIAAGEVVERPASVVKELVENSIDADASRVAVAVESGGTERIRISDDGVGMAADELERAVQKHTTSKIRDIDDLETGVATLGFRGEALHAIGAVSRMTITSRPRDGGRGTELTVEGGEVTDISPAGCPIGTTIEIRDLFYNVPARRKYLKQDATEFAHVNTVTTSYALANPGVAVTLEHDSRETFATNGTGELRETVLSVYGREVAESMRPIESEDTQGPLQSVEGLVSHPETNRASREYLSTFVNGRYVTANAVREAVVDAYDTQLAPDRYPFAVLFLELDPATVDVNVHPRKLEVRFADEEAVREQIRETVEQALLRDGLLRSSAPRGRSAPEQTEIRPERDRPTPESSTDPLSERTDDGTSRYPDTQTTSTSIERTTQDANSRTATPTTEDDASTVSEPPASQDERHASDVSSSTTTSSAEERTATGQSSAGAHERSDRRRKFRESGRQERLGAHDRDVEFDQLPSMRVLGQFKQTYVVAETDDGLVLVDQHAADERVNYERLKASFTGETTTQALAEPVQLELTAGEAALFEAHSAALSRLGFHAALVDGRVAEVRTVPATVAESAGPELIRDVLSEFVRGAESAAETVEAAVDDLLADLACYPSVTGNTSLTEGSVVDLLSALDGCDNPYACPHGRPVIVELNTDEIEARFERDYPGHE